MKKLIAITLTLVLVPALTVPASAASTMRWDWNKARQSIGRVASEIARQEITELAVSEYDAPEESNPESDREMIQSWREWATNRMKRLDWGEDWK